MGADLGSDERRTPEQERLQQLTRTIIGAAIDVHKALGRGMLESVYENCLAFELRERDLKVERQKPVPVVYKSVRMECGYRLDLVVEDAVIIELKAVETLVPIHEAQLLSYPRLTGYKLGLLINFHSRTIHEGLRR